METLTTSGIKISVKTDFRGDLSELLESQYFHNYHITIQNHNNFDVQLISREWYIFDSLGDARYVHGVGVVGEQPVLRSGEIFNYTSGCDLQSEVGMMKGFYTFKNLTTGKVFEVFVPTFKLEFVGKLN